MTFARRGRALLLGLTVLAGTTACTSSSASPAATGNPGSVTAVDTPTAPPSTVPVTTTAPPPPSSSAPPSSSSPAPSTRPPAVANPPTPKSTCPSLTARVIEGSASVGQEFAALQFTNTGSKPCLLTGFPSVTLLLNGRQLGYPSQPANSMPHAMTLQPGDTAESQLHDFTSCQASLSDNARVVFPGSTQSVVRPLQMRGCTLRVDPLGPPS